MGQHGAVEGARIRESDVDRRAAEARIGTAVERHWRLDAMIGLGGMAAVYAATHTSGGRAAFKIMHARLADDAQLVTRFVRERSIAAKVCHPACIDIRAVGATEEGVPLLFMELLEGETLEDHVARERRLSLGAALDVAERLLELLEACHGAGVVHRDLKPANVFLLADGRLKVIDFGVAQESSRRQTNRRLAIGTPSYMSPEQARGAMDVDLRSDLFAVGAIFFRMVIGRELREHGPGGALRDQRTPTDAQLAAASDFVPSIGRAAPGLPYTVARTIDRALSWQRDERWSSAEAMLRELRMARACTAESRLRAPAGLDEDDDDTRAEMRTDPGTPSAIRQLRQERPAGSDPNGSPRAPSSASRG
jgi:serine/threonine protein kinase